MRLDKEINEGGAALTNLRENRRLRKLQSNIQATQKEIDSFDIEGASKARRNFDEKYQPEKDRENEMQQTVTYPSLPPRSVLQSPVECSSRGRADFVESFIAKTRDGPCRVQKHQQAVYGPACEGQGRLLDYLPRKTI